jgi:hypothetical protein
MRVPATRYLQFYFVVSLASVLTDALCFGVSTNYRNRLGDVRSLADASIDIIPNAILISFYATACYKLFTTGSLNRLVLMLQSSFFSIVAVLMCIPFVGYIISILTPLNTLYSASLIFWKKDWPINWYYFSCGLLRTPWS